MATGGLPRDHPIYFTLLSELNALRKFEDRPKLSELPYQYLHLSNENLLALSQRYRTEAEWHKNQKKHNLSRGLPYKNQILLNETEYLLWEYNKRQVQANLEQIQSVQPSLVSTKDSKLYFADLVIRDPVFITDSDCRLINTPTYIQSQKLYRATHELKVTKALPSEPTLSVFSDFDFLPSSTPLNISRDLLGLDLQGLKISDDDILPNNLVKSNSDQTIETNKIVTGPQVPQRVKSPPTYFGAIPKRFGKFKHPKLKEVNTPDKGGDTPNTDEESNSKTIIPNPKYKGFYIPPATKTPPEFADFQVPIIPEKIDHNARLKSFQMDQLNRRIEALEKEKAKLASDLAKQTVKPRAAHTERQEINDLKTQMNDMMTMMKMMTLGRHEELNATTENETRVAAKFQQSNFEDNSFTTQNMFVTLDRPTNIIDAKTKRTPETLPCLKPSAIINTIGTFDPVAQPEADFRSIWDRILDQTRNYKIYEHEYVTCLRIVMKGQAGIELDKMIKEYKGDLDLILDAIQDLFLPQHTIYDELVDLKSFSRKPNEHMRTMVRRASLVVCKLKPTVAPAAWPDRRHTLLSQMIKQVIDRQTFAHLRSEELRCAQAGTTLSIEAITNIIDYYETSHDLIPKNEIKMQYDVHSMRLANQPDINKSEIDCLKDEIMALKTNILAPKRRRFSDPAEKSSGSPKTGNRPVAKAKRRFTDSKMDTSDYSVPSQKGTKRTYESAPKQYSYTPNPSPLPAQYSYSQAQSSQSQKSASQRLSQPKLSTQSSRSSSQPRARSSTPAQYRSLDYYKPRYNNNGYNRSRSKSPYRNKSNYRGRSPYRNYGYNNKARKSYNFRGKKHDVALNFYKCAICPDAHETGTSCTVAKAISHNPND